MTTGAGWLQLVLDVDEQSEYADVRTHEHRVDWLGRATSFTSMALVGFVVIAAGVGIAGSRPAVEQTTAELRERVLAAQRAANVAQAAYQAARLQLKATQDAVRPDIGGALAAELDRQTIASAYVGLRGPGIELTIDNSKKPTFSGTTDLGQVIDRDLQHAVNGLWQAGAEAISVNGVRLTGRTSIRNAGATILVDYRPVSAPYRIVALGDAALLLKRLKANPEWNELQTLSDRYRIRWGIAASKQLQVPAGASTLPNRATAGGDL